LDPRRETFIGDWDLSQSGRVEGQDPRRGTFSPPSPGFIETNSNQPCPETGFEPKLFEVGECLKRALLNDILDIHVTADRCLDRTQQWREVRGDQVSEEISPPAEDLMN
jgi:hypothetical protein